MTKIDYAKCYYYDDGICFNEECMTKYCEGYDCLIKQLQRVKQKLGKIKEIVTDELNLKFDITDKLNTIKEIIEEEQ